MQHIPDEEETRRSPDTSMNSTARAGLLCFWGTWARHEDGVCEKVKRGRADGEELPSSCAGVVRHDSLSRNGVDKTNVCCAAAVVSRQAEKL